MARRPSLDYAAGGIIDQLRQQRREEDQGRTQRLNMAIAGIIKGLQTGGQLWEKQQQKKLAELKELAPMAAYDASQRYPMAGESPLGAYEAPKGPEAQDVRSRDPIEAIRPTAPPVPRVPRETPEALKERLMLQSDVDTFLGKKEELSPGGEDRAVEFLGWDPGVVESFKDQDKDFVPPPDKKHRRPIPAPRYEAAPPAPRRPSPPPVTGPAQTRRQVTPEEWDKIVSDTASEARDTFTRETADKLAAQLGVTRQEAFRAIALARFAQMQTQAVRKRKAQEDELGHGRAMELARVPARGRVLEAGIKAEGSLSEAKLKSLTDKAVAWIGKREAEEVEKIVGDWHRDVARTEGDAKIEAARAKGSPGSQASSISYKTMLGLFKMSKGITEKIFSGIEMDEPSAKLLRQQAEFFHSEGLRMLNELRAADPGLTERVLATDTELVGYLDQMSIENPKVRALGEKTDQAKDVVGH